MKWWSDTSRGRKVALAAGLAVAVASVAVGSAYATTTAMNMANPLTIVRALLAPPSERAKLFPSRLIPASGYPRPAPRVVAALPRSVPWKGGTVSTDEFLTTTNANSFLVLNKGRLVHEWYRHGVTATTPQWSYSVAKSVTSLLAGIAIDKGKLREDERLVDVLPELRSGTEYDTVTIRNLLDMTSGVDVSENTSSVNPFAGTIGMGLSTDLGEFYQAHRGLRFTPGSKGEYRSVDTGLLASAVMRREGQSLSELLQGQIWNPMGAEDPATWTVDHPGGREQGFAGLNATARDFAKIGQLVLDNGAVGGKQILPRTWIDRIRTKATLPVNTLGYSAQWWHYPGGNGADFSAVGIYGQYIFVDPLNSTVIVKLSDHGTEQDEQETMDAFRVIAQQISAA